MLASGVAVGVAAGVVVVVLVVARLSLAASFVDEPLLQAVKANVAKPAIQQSLQSPINNALTNTFKLLHITSLQTSTNPRYSNNYPSTILLF